MLDNFLRQSSGCPEVDWFFCRVQPRRKKLVLFVPQDLHILLIPKFARDAGRITWIIAGAIVSYQTVSAELPVKKPLIIPLVIQGHSASFIVPDRVAFPAISIRYIGTGPWSREGRMFIVLPCRSLSFSSPGRFLPPSGQNIFQGRLSNSLIAGNT